MTSVEMHTEINPSPLVLDIGSPSIKQHKQDRATNDAAFRWSATVEALASVGSPARSGDERSADPAPGRAGQIFRWFDGSGLVSPNNESGL